MLSRDRYPNIRLDGTTPWRFPPQQELEVSFWVEAENGASSFRWFKAFTYEFNWRPGQFRIFYPAQFGCEASVEDVLFMKPDRVVHLDDKGGIKYGPTQYVEIESSGDAPEE